MKQLIILCLFALSTNLYCIEENKEEIVKLSEAMGQLIGKNLQSIGVPIDMDALVKGMKDGCKNNGIILSEDECIAALEQLQEKSAATQAEKNLKEANEFLKTNSSHPGIVSLEKGKIQYKIVKSGSGDAVQSYNSPIVRYKGHYLSGESFGSSIDNEVISLDETIDGFSKGVLGMHEGEVRTIYIHPDLGYGSRSLSNPNALLVFEVELLKADASADAQAASNAEDAIQDPFTKMR